MLELMYSTGLRVSELVGLRLKNLDLDGRFVRVIGKGDKERIAPLTETAVGQLRRYLERHKVGASAGEWMFPGGTPGSHITRQAFWQKIKKYAEQAGIASRVTPHTLRHSVATHLIMNGASVAEVSEILGHSKLDTTMIYTHLDSAHLKQVVKECHPRERSRK